MNNQSQQRYENIFWNHADDLRREFHKTFSAKELARIQNSPTAKIPSIRHAKVLTTYNNVAAKKGTVPLFHSLLADICKNEVNVVVVGRIAESMILYAASK